MEGEDTEIDRNADNNLTDAEIYNLIFRPGFSTAKKVTDISGRGVGMDVVKKGIDKLRGRVEVFFNARSGFHIYYPVSFYSCHHRRDAVPGGAGKIYHSDVIHY